MPAMFDYSAVAVEIWQQILLAVMDVPFVLDILQEREGCYWYRQGLYHDEAVYESSECQRRALRRVCRSWRAFADEQKYRWITYTSEGGPPCTEWEHDLEILHSAANSSQSDEACTMSRPQRIKFHIISSEDTALFLKFTTHFSNKLNTLFIECGDGYEDAIFQSMLAQGTSLHALRCLLVRTPRFCATPLRLLSRAFPKLLDLAMRQGTKRIEQSSDDILVLPELENLDMNLSMFKPGALESWVIPRLVHLSTTILGIRFQSAEVSYHPLKVHGAYLGFLNISRLESRDIPMRLPGDLWTWCPRLIELRACMSAVYLDAPIPAEHPLKYIIHWPHYDILANTHLDEPVGFRTPLFLHNLQLLPVGFEVLIISRNWPTYQGILDGRYRQEVRDKFLVWMYELAKERRIRVEDSERMELSEFLLGIIPVEE